mmetsp:Transcript_16265/g.26538  ORF Transcript_16265/g.26538 Transcript_16265/m.26538 type:complete len:440 (+) Transcript_16265:202-1521(+)
MPSTTDDPEPSSSSLLVGDIATPVADPKPEQASTPPPNPYAPASSNKMGSISDNTEKPNSRPSSMRSGMAMLVLMVILCICAIIAIVLLGSLVGTISSQENQAPATIYINSGSGSDSTAGAATGSIAVEDLLPQAPAENGENACAGASPGFANVDCIIDGMTNVGPQAGANVTKGFKGDMQVDYEPITTSLFKAGLCPVNVHWHLGAEHYSLGEFDENGKGVRKIDWVTDGGSAGALGSFQCHHYNETKTMFTRKYDFKHCIGMEVGQTYEVHWPHSAAGACGTPDQYQNPFYDGVFCNLDLDTFNTLTPTQIATNVGVQSQVFTVVNDETYFRPNLMRGMIVDGEFGTDLAIYTGSSTGSSRSNNVCSPYSPITWQVDRKCQLISASSFDLMCAEMKMNRDDLTYDLIAHGARPLMSKNLTADNQQNRDRKLRGNIKN